MTATNLTPGITIIRRLTGDDVAAWRTLTVRRRQTSTPGTFGDQSLPDHEIATDHLTVPPAQSSTFAVETQGRMIGCARVTTSDNHVWTLTTVYLDHEFRGRGLGHLLVSATIQTVPPGHPIELWVAANNPAAADLYRRLGFVVSATVWLEDPTAWTHMRREPDHRSLSRSRTGRTVPATES